MSILFRYGALLVGEELVGEKFQLEYRIKPISTGIWGSWTKATTISDILLTDSIHISNNGVDETTALLTAPSGKTTGDFQAGRLSDDINPISVIDLVANKYTEIEFNLSFLGLLEGDEVEFRLTDNQVELGLYSVNPKITVTAAAASTYTVTYNGNTNDGGTVPTDATNYEEMDLVTVLGNTGSLVKTGFTFIGWNTEANGLGISYVENDTFLMGTANITLYAVWTEVTELFTIYFGSTKIIKMYKGSTELSNFIKPTI